MRLPCDFARIDAPLQFARDRVVLVAPLEIDDVLIVGKDALSGCAFEHPDGSPMAVDTDYSGKPRDPANPGAGPFAGLKSGNHEIKVWPKSEASCSP